MNLTKLTLKEIEMYKRLLHGEVIPPDIRVYQIIRRLRKKSGDNSVETRHGEGYILGPDENLQVDFEKMTFIKNKEG